ncbi:regulation of intralumenal vesicle formation [Desmophyllum pertusum]|uniref:Regulation of intralumenal vesicle formation n=1 Tax=Desmophyllum pertusum TaxID=174260 RepID=A0A9W9ZPP6_9CNID|nr:regulation of intralumenal vesicle formation [Desmophyllum pertusum]
MPFALFILPYWNNCYWERVTESRQDWDNKPKYLPLPCDNTKALLPGRDLKWSINNLYCCVFGLIWEQSSQFIAFQVGFKCHRIMASRRPQKLPIFVRFNSNTNIPVQVDLQWNIAKLKEEIAQRQGVDPKEIRIIFAGRELKDDLQLKDAEIPNQSVIHAVRGGRWSARAVKGITTPLSKVNLATVGEEEQAAESNNSTDGASAQRQAQYFVYCKTCKLVTPGKLRVRCSTCKEGAMVLQQDPSSWEDVLKSGRIRGSCKTGGCEGEIADEIPVLRVAYSSVRLFSRDPVLVFPCNDGHAVCLDCFEIYCTTKLNDRQFVNSDTYGYTLPARQLRTKMVTDKTQSIIGEGSVTSTSFPVSFFMPFSEAIRDGLKTKPGSEVLEGFDSLAVFYFTRVRSQ